MDKKNYNQIMYDEPSDTRLLPRVIHQSWPGSNVVDIIGPSMAV